MTPVRTFPLSCVAGSWSLARDQLVQLMDLYPTVLSAVGVPPGCPAAPLHGIDLTVLENADAPTRSCALMGML